MDDFDFWMLILVFIVNILVEHVPLLICFIVGMKHCYYIVNIMLQQFLLHKNSLKDVYYYKALYVCIFCYISITLVKIMHKCMIKKPSIKIWLPSVLQKCLFECDNVKVKSRDKYKKYNSISVFWEGIRNVFPRNGIVYAAVLDCGEYCRYIFRLASFLSMPLPATRLASNGYYWNHHTQEITCYSCNQVLTPEEAEARDFKPRHGPRCCLVVNDRLDFEPIEEGISSLPSASHGNSSSETPSASGGACASTKENENGHTDDVAGRVATFNGVPWIGSPENLTAERMAKLGFSYRDSDDVVRCQHCNRIFRGWHLDLSVLIKAHRESSPQCPCAQLKGFHWGPDFIPD